MDLQRKNKSINISKSEFETMCLIKEGMLGTCTHLMGKKERDELFKNNGSSQFPYPFTFYSVENESTIKASKIGDTLDLICEDKLVGSISIKDKFKNNKSIVDIFTPNSCDIQELGDTCIGGELELLNSSIKKIKDSFNQRRKELNAQNITAIITSLDPLHKGHERIFRWAIDKADLLVLFLIESFDKDGLDFELKMNCLNALIKNYLPADRIFIFPLKDINIFHSHLNPLLEAIIAKSLGCNKLIVGQKHEGLGMFFDNNRAKTVLDDFIQHCNMNVVVLPELVFCEECKSIVTTKSCPHGSHHHVKFNDSSLRQLLKLGIIPPTLFMRAEISSIILSKFFPNRFKNMQKIYNNLFANNGILEQKKDDDFHHQLLKLYQITHTV